MTISRRNFARLAGAVLLPLPHPRLRKVQSSGDSRQAFRRVSRVCGARQYVNEMSDGKFTIGTSLERACDP
jgi:hypothetical protein